MTGEEMSNPYTADGLPVEADKAEKCTFYTLKTGFEADRIPGKPIPF